MVKHISYVVCLVYRELEYHEQFKNCYLEANNLTYAGHDVFADVLNLITH